MVLPQNVVHACCKQDMHYDLDGVTANCVNHTTEGELLRVNRACLHE